MISPQLAQRLKQAGLRWRPSRHDFFWIPERTLDDRIFVISDLQANLELYKGWPVVTFHGTAEWALDYILQQDVVWLPTEEQLREQLLEHVEELALTYKRGSHNCTVVAAGKSYLFPAAGGSDAYGEALLFLLLEQGLREGSN